MFLQMVSLGCHDEVRMMPTSRMSAKETKSLVVLVFKSWREMAEPSMMAYTPSPAV